MTDRLHGAAPRTGVGPLLAAWPALLAASLAVVLGRLLPLVSPLLWALLLGVLVANTRLAAAHVVTDAQPGSRTLLRLGIVGFGALLTWESLRDMGWAGLAVIGCTVVGVFVGTCWVGDRMGLPRGLVTLVASGFAVCGAAAIAAVEGNIRRRDEDVGVALALVTLCGTAMIIVIPALGLQLGLTPQEVAVWAGASIHEVAQVAAAASVVGGASVLATAMAIKLGRVALLVLAHWGALLREGSNPFAGQARPGAPLVPWFLVGFALVALVGSSGLLPAAGIAVVRQLGVWLLAAGMFGLGLGIEFRQLFPMPWRVVQLALASTLLATALPLVLIVSLMR